MLDRRTLVAGALGAGAASLVSRPALAQQDVLGATEPLAPPQGVPQLRLRHAFSLSIFFDERIRIRSDAGRVFVPVVGGEIWGPRLQGRVVPYGGGDYAGAHGLDASYMLEAADGAMIYINNRGYMKREDGAKTERGPAPPRQPGEVPEQSFVAPPDSDIPLRMRLMPAFNAPEGPHDWMNSTVFVGHGGRFTNPDHTIFTYYEVL